MWLNNGKKKNDHNSYGIPIQNKLEIVSITFVAAGQESTNNVKQLHVGRVFLANPLPE